MLKQAKEARQMAANAVDPSHAKACLELAEEFEKLAEKLQVLEQSGMLKNARSGYPR